MTVTREKTIPYVDDTITKKVMANVIVISLYECPRVEVKSSKNKHIATVHVYKSEHDFVSKYDIKPQPTLFKTFQF